MKNIVVLLSFILCPAIHLGKFDFLSDKNFFDFNRLQISNRVYAAPVKTQQNQENSMPPKKYATNIHVGHELSLFADVESTYWNISQKTDAGVPPSERISTTKFRQMAPGVFLRYAYHIPFSKNFGFFLGTTVGMVLTSMGKDNFRAGYSIFFPTILIGFTGTPVPADRLTIGTEYGATWYPEMVVYTNDDSRRPLNATLDMWNVYAQNDYFFLSDIAFSVSLGIRVINNICKLQFLCTDANYINRLKIRNTTYYGQVGFVFGDLR